MRPDARRCGVSTPPFTGSWDRTRRRRSRGGVSLVGFRPKERAGKFLGRECRRRDRQNGRRCCRSRRGPPGFNLYATCFEAVSAAGCSGQVVPMPACVTSEQSWRSNHMTICRTSGSGCWQRTHAGSTKRGMRPTVRIRFCRQPRSFGVRRGDIGICRASRSHPLLTCAFR